MDLLSILGPLLGGAGGGYAAGMMKKKQGQPVDPMQDAIDAELKKKSGMYGYGADYMAAPAQAPGVNTFGQRTGVIGGMY